MRKNFVMVLMMIGVLVGVVFSQDITDKFTCPDFLSMVREKLMKGSNEPIFVADVDTVKELNVSRRGILLGITSLDGIEYFTGLIKLDAIDNQFTIIDLSNNAALEYLNISRNYQLTSLDLSNNTKLEYLNVEDNQLTVIDLSNNTKLTHFIANWTQLTSIDLGNNIDLEYLSVQSNQLSALDLSNNTALKRLHVRYNQLTIIDLSNNTALEHLDAHENQLTTLDLSNNYKLEYLHLSDNQLTELDVSKNTELTYLSVQGNHFCSIDNIIGLENTQIDLANFYISPQNTEHCGETSTVYTVSFNSNGGTTADDITQPNEGVAITLPITTREDYIFKGWYTEINCQGIFIGNADASYTPTDNITLYACWEEVTTEPEPKNIRDSISCDNFRAIVYALIDKADPDPIYADDLIDIDSLFLCNKGITSLEGIKYFENLVYLDAGNSCDVLRSDNRNTITEIDLSRNTLLEYLDLSGNMLERIDLLNNTQLGVIDLSNNQLTEINLARNTALEELNLSHNLLERIDLIENVNLRELDISHNLLSEINIAKNEMLENLNVAHNKIEKLSDVIGLGNTKVTDFDLGDQATSVRAVRKAGKRGVLAKTVVRDEMRVVLEGVTRVVVYDNLGNVVYDGTDTVWDLRNAASRRVAEGSYLVVVETTTVVYSAKLGVKK